MDPNYPYSDTKTIYSGDNAPGYGMALSVTEDATQTGGGTPAKPFGNRTTQTLVFHPSGKAIKTKDGMGREFLSAYDLDLNLLEVKRVDSGLDKRIVTYSYGTSGIANRVLISVPDGQSRRGADHRAPRGRRRGGPPARFGPPVSGPRGSSGSRRNADRPTWRYHHDGQAPFEDDVTYDPGSGTRKDVTRYALGARGGDMAETVLAMGSSGERTVRSYPLYDGHGNTVGQVARAEDGAPDASFAPVPGAANFALGARRKCGAWGQVRWSEGSPLDQGYCGNLQHRRDAESGLVYMRARYYEPWTGRFLSEDPAMDGANWYVYCANDPVSKVDPTGRVVEQAIVGLLKFLLGLFIMGEIDTVVSRIHDLTRYMNQLDTLIEHSVSTGKSLVWPETQQRAIRDEMRGLQNRLRALRFKAGIVRAGSIVGKTIDKILGYALVVSALLDDIDLGPNGLGSLEGIFGD